MLSPSPYFINEVTEVEMLIISLKVSLWESNLALVQYQILWPRKLEFQKGGLPWWVYDCLPPGSWDKNVLDGHNWWGIVRGITVSPQYSDSFVSDYKQCLRLEQNWWGSMFHSHGYGICCLAGMPKRDTWDGMENSKAKLQNMRYLSSEGNNSDFYKLFKEQQQFIKIDRTRSLHNQVHLFHFAFGF